MELICYLYEGWTPRIRAASQRRDWMDQTPEAFAYRCLPLNIANAHGWEILAGCAFEAEWNGGPLAEDVTIYPDAGAGPTELPVALFGQGTFTFHVQGLFRTPPGWNLWVGGPPNGMKDGVAPLNGVIETDWSPYTFTMNWRFTRPGHRVRFEAGEVICHIFPIQRDVVETTEPIFLPIEADPDLKLAFETWSRSRDAFQAEVERNPPVKPADKWQKLYYRGVRPDGSSGVEDHRAKLRPREFISGPSDHKGATTGLCPVSRHSMYAPIPGADARSIASEQDGRVAALEAELARARLDLAKREWVLENQKRLRVLAPAVDGLFRHTDLTPNTFLDEFYAVNRPVVLGGVAAGWAASRLWTPDYLRDRCAGTEVEVQAGRGSDPDYERNKDAHRHLMPFGAFMDEAVRPGADVYLTAYNASTNRQALSSLAQDLGDVPGILDAAGGAAGMLWIGPQGTFTPLHHDLTSNLLIQIQGRKQVTLAAPDETARLYNDRHVFSEVRDLLALDVDFERYPLLRGVKVQTLTLEPGDALFIPVGWWHQVRALDFSVSLTCTNFAWPNDAWQTFPA